MDKQGRYSQSKKNIIENERRVNTFMNEIIPEGYAIANEKYEITDIIRIIAENMIRTRPQKEVEYFPYTYSPYIKNKRLGYIEVDLDGFHPDAIAGDAAFVKTILVVPEDCQLLLSINHVNAVWLNDTKITNDEWDRKTAVPVNLNKGENILEMQCIKDDSFKMSFCVSLKRYPGMWASDYICHCEATVPLPGYECENGIAVSKIVKNKETTDSYVFPSEYKDTEQFDFNNLIGVGNVAYALTYPQGQISIEHFGGIKIMVDGVCEYTSDGSGTATIDANGKAVLIKCIKSEGWGFRVISGKGSLPFVKTADEKNLRFLWSGGYGDDKAVLATPFAPEFGVDLKKPMPDGRGGNTYWRFNRDNTVLRPRLETSFFGQWFYALMVGLYGLKTSAEVLDDAKYFKYFNDSIQTMVSYFDLMCYDSALFENSSFLQRAMEVDSLDSIGTMGMNISDYYNMTGNKEALPLLNTLLNRAKTLVPRKPDGSFYRVKTMWADDIYMSCPFLARIGKITGDESCFDEVALQLKNYKKWLWMEDKQLFSHIYFTDTQQANRIPWGRGNGWIFLTLSDILQIIPETHKDFEFLLELYKEFASGILNHFDREEKMWHQVISMPSSYLETSATGMFTIGFARGVQKGWLSSEYKEAALIAWEGLCEKRIDKSGAVYGVCMGSECSMEAQYYFDIPTIKNDDHGTGIILVAASEIMKLL